MSTKSKKAFITGAYGQDGFYLSKYLLSLGYEVLGLARKAEANSPNGIKLKEDEHFHELVGDLTNESSYSQSLKDFSPGEIYNLAAISDLKTAASDPEGTLALNFEAFKALVAVSSGLEGVKVFQALSSRILIPDGHGVINETSLLTESADPYDVSKKRAYEEVVLPGRKNGCFISAGFLCNHESPIRGDRFVTWKIAKIITLIREGKEEKLTVGNTEAKRDWSFAGDVVRAMHDILSLDKPDDYVIGSGTLHSVRDFISCAFAAIGAPISWKGEGLGAKAYDEQGILRVEVAPEFYQEDDNPVCADISKLKKDTGWSPKVSFEELVTMMVTAAS